MKIAPTTAQRLSEGADRFVKDFEAEVRPVEGAARRHRFTITTGAVDRERDVLAPDGWKLDAFLRNPVVLWAHDYHEPPIAVARTIERTPTGLVSEAEFVDPAAYPFAGTVEALVRMGALSAASVGFRPITWNYNEERRGVDFVEQELLEYSIVPVPANPQCLVEARAAGIDVEPLREWASRTLERLGGPPAGGNAVARFAVLAADGSRKTYSFALRGGEMVLAPEAGAGPAREPAEAAPADKAPAPAEGVKAEDHDPEDCPEGDCPMKGESDAGECDRDGCPMRKQAPTARAAAGEFDLTSFEDFDLEAASFALPALDGDPTPAEVGAALRATLPGLVDEAVRRAVAAARGRLD